MKRNLLKIVGIVVILYISALLYISAYAEKEFDRYIESMNRFNPYVESKVIGYNGKLTGAQAEVKTEIKDALLKKRVEEYLKTPVDMNMTLKYGPLLFLSDGIGFGAVGVEKSMLISSIIKKGALREYKSVFPDDISVALTSAISFTDRAKESMKVDIKRILDHTEELEFQLTPIEIVRDYDIYTLKGVNRLHTKSIQIHDLKSKKRLIELDNINAKFKLDDISAEGLIYGDYNLNVDSVKLHTETAAGQQGVQFSSYGRISLKKAAKEYANLRIESRLKALNSSAKSMAMGIDSVKTVIELNSLGSKGLEELLTLQKKRVENRRVMERAAAKGDAEALGKALANVARLDNELVPVINRIFIKGKSKIDIKDEISSDKKSYIHLNATYMGEPLKGDIMNALVVLAARADRLFDAHLDIKMEKSLTKKLYPQAGWILDSMVKKGMAKLENGYYTLKADMKEGKIIINGTKYAPQEFIMMILM